MLVCPSWELDVENQALETRMLPRRNTGGFFFRNLSKLHLGFDDNEDIG